MRCAHDVGEESLREGRYYGYLVMILRIAGREVGTWAFLTRFNRKEEFKPEFVDAEAFAGMLKEDDNPASSNTGGGDMPGNGD